MSAEIEKDKEYETKSQDEIIKLKTVKINELSEKLAKAMADIAIKDNKINDLERELKTQKYINEASFVKYNSQQNSKHLSNPNKVVKTIYEANREQYLASKK